MQLGIFAVLVLLWGVPLVNPFKLLVVLFHEFSHLIAAYATGGVPFGIAIQPAGAGVTLGLGGNEVIVAMAGYVGSFAVGVALYWLSAKWEATDVWMGLFLVSCLSLAFGWLNDFTAMFGYGTLFIMGAGNFLFSPRGKLFFLRVVAATSCLYPVIDVFSTTLMFSDESGMTVNGAAVLSDVEQLEVLTGMNPVVIATVWIIISASACVSLIWWSAEKDAEQQVKRRFFRPRPPRLLDPIYDPHDASSVREYWIK